MSELLNPPVGLDLLSTPTASTSSQKSKATNSKSRKRDAFGETKYTKESPINSITRFTIGKSDPVITTNAKRKLHMEETKNASAKPNHKLPLTQKKVVTFQKAGSLSPSKRVVAQSEEKVAFEKDRTLSPSKVLRIKE